MTSGAVQPSISTGSLARIRIIKVAPSVVLYRGSTGLSSVSLSKPDSTIPPRSLLPSAASTAAIVAPFSTDATTSDGANEHKDCKSRNGETTDYTTSDSASMRRTLVGGMHEVKGQERVENSRNIESGFTHVAARLEPRWGLGVGDGISETALVGTSIGVELLVKVAMGDSKLGSIVGS